MICRTHPAFYVVAICEINGHVNATTLMVMVKQIKEKSSLVKEDTLSNVSSS